MWDRPLKNLARMFALDVGPKKSVLMLPGKSALDVKAAIEKGIITSRTRCLFVERDEETAEQLKSQLESLKGMPNNWRIHQGNLESVVLTEPVDYAFLDLCGPITFDIVQWLDQELSPHLMTGSDLVINFAYGHRHCSFGKELREFFDTADDDIVQYQRNVSLQFGQTIVGDPTAVRIVCLLKSIFWNYRYECPPPLKYKDRDKVHSMLTVRFNDMCRCETNELTLAMHRLLEFVYSRTTKGRAMASVTKHVKRDRHKTMVAAGFKSWETRRENEQKRKRHLAAVKAWETRRRKCA